MGPKVPLASLRTTYYCLLEPNYKKRVLSHQSVSFQFNTPLWDFGNPQKKCFFTSRNDIRWPKYCNLQYFWIYSLWPLQMHLPLTQISFILTNGNQQLCRKYLNAFTLGANIFYIDKSEQFSQKPANFLHSAQTALSKTVVFEKVKRQLKNLLHFCHHSMNTSQLDRNIYMP